MKLAEKVIGLYESKTIKQLAAQISKNLAAEIKLDDELSYKREFGHTNAADRKREKAIKDNQEKIFKELRDIIGLDGNKELDDRDEAVTRLQAAGLSHDSIIGCLIALNYEV